MPKASVDEDQRPTPSEYEIRLPLEPRPVEAVAIAQAVDETANTHFRACVATANPRHALAAFVRSERVHRHPNLFAL